VERRTVHAFFWNRLHDTGGFTAGCRQPYLPRPVTGGSFPLPYRTTDTRNLFGFLGWTSYFAFYVPFGQTPVPYSTHIQHRHSGCDYGRFLAVHSYAVGHSEPVVVGVLPHATAYPLTSATASSSPLPGTGIHKYYVHSYLSGGVVLQLSWND